jgi:hypothetical protein
LKTGLQAALWAVEGVPLVSQTDQSSTATHQLKRASARRGFNAEYLALCEHLGLQPRTIGVGNPNQNGDIEAAQGTLKRRIKNQLILRRSRDFPSVAAYAEFVGGVCRAANALRSGKLAEERVALRPLPAARFPETQELTVRVSSYSTVRVRDCAYSVPARFIGTTLTAHLTEEAVRFCYRGEQVASYQRSTSRAPRIDYRHLIDSLVKKPGAFARYIYREELFPRPVFRQAFDRLQAVEERKASERYLRVLQLAAIHDEDRVADLLGAILRQGGLPLADAMAEQLRGPSAAPPATIAPFTPEFGSYDALIEEVAS